MKVIDIIIRIACFPFLLGLTLIAANARALSISFLMLINGGEWISYKRGEKKMIADIFEKLKSEEKKHG